MRIHFFAAGLCLLLASCQTPVTNSINYTASAQTSSGLPLGVAESVYVGSSDGNGVLQYLKGSTGWTQLDWSAFYPVGKSPVIYGLAISNGAIYAATSDGLVVTSSHSLARYNIGTLYRSVTIDEAHSQILLTSKDGLTYASLPLTSAFQIVPMHNAAGDGQANQAIVSGSTVYAATASGLMSSTPVPMSGSSTFGQITGASAGYISAGYVRSLSVQSSSLIFAGTAIGLSYGSGTSWTDIAASPTGGLHGAVNGAAGNTIGFVLAATDKGLSGAYASSPSSWTFLGSTAVPVLGIAASSDNKTFYAANGIGGLGIVTCTSPTPGGTSWYTALASLSVSCVAIGP